MSINKVILVGRVGADAETIESVKTTIAKFRMATNSQNGKDEDTQWHSVKTFGKLAEQCSKYVTKGRQVYVEGRLNYETWKDKEGNTRHYTEIIANTVEFLGKPSDAEGTTSRRPAARSSAPDENSEENSSPEAAMQAEEMGFQG